MVEYVKVFLLLKWQKSSRYLFRHFRSKNAVVPTFLCTSSVGSYLNYALSPLASQLAKKNFSPRLATIALLAFSLRGERGNGEWRRQSGRPSSSRAQGGKGSHPSAREVDPVPSAAEEKRSEASSSSPSDRRSPSRSPASTTPYRLQR